MKFPRLSKFSKQGQERNCHHHHQHGDEHIVEVSSKTSSKALQLHHLRRSNQVTIKSSSWNHRQSNILSPRKSQNDSFSVQIAPPAAANGASQNGLVIMAAAAAAQAPAIPRIGVLILDDDSSDDGDDNEGDHIAPPPLSCHDERARQSNPRNSWNDDNHKGSDHPNSRTKKTAPYHTKRTYQDEVDDDLDRKAKEKRKGTTIVPPYATRQNRRGTDHYRNPWSSFSASSSRNTLHPTLHSPASPPYNIPFSHHHPHSYHYNPCSYERLGHASLQLYKVQLPNHFSPLLEQVVRASEDYAQTLPHGWRTNLYSLTQQDVSLSHIPQLNVQPLLDYVRDCMQYLYPAPPAAEDREDHHGKATTTTTTTTTHHYHHNDHDTRRHRHRHIHPKRKIVMDVYQPHVLKYSVQDRHVGVELHHDKCDITCNLMLSSMLEYTGGGTWIPAMGGVIRLNFGEFLLHPGSLLHGGVDITSGCRYLMILFADFES